MGDSKVSTTLVWAAAAAAVALAACDDPVGSLEGQPNGNGNGSGDGPETAALATKVPAGPPMSRNLSNREYLATMTAIIGAPIPNEVAAGWTATTQFSGFDAVPWTNLDAKAIRDRAESAEKILDIALASPKVMSCSETTAECAKKIVESFATRAYGRPLAPEEKDSLFARYDEGVALGKTMLTDAKAVHLDGLRSAIGSVLLAPQVLTRVETPPSPDFTGERELDAYELASRLAFMFTGSIPDDELWATASDGSLKEESVLIAQATRLLDTRTDSFVQQFMGQWFDFRAFDSAKPGSIENAMYEESWRTLADVVKDGKPMTALVQPGFTYVNADLAKHYSLVGTFPGELTRVDTSERGGVLQLGSWLTASASPLKTSPIHRGRLVQDRLLCKVVPPPDSSLFEQIQKVSASIPPTASVKERLEQHRKAGDACQGCHEYMDPIGLGLEGFDQHGRLRRAYADSGKEVEVASNLLGKPFATFNELNGMLAALPEYQRCAAEKLTVYSLRRVVDGKGNADDVALLDYLGHAEGGKPPSIKDMVLRLVKSKAFRSVNHAKGAT
jgi:hypothetical protein